jgi:hypothetical protein
MEFPSGWLVKGGGSFRNWRKRWAQFVKDDEVLLIYDRPSGRLKRTVTLKSIESVVAMSREQEVVCFCDCRKERCENSTYSLLLC